MKAIELESAFMLDAQLREQRRAVSSRRVHTMQIPLVRAVGFAILSLMVALYDMRLGESASLRSLLQLLAINAAYAGLSWAALHLFYGRTGRLDLSLAFLHVDLLVWLVNLNHFEYGNPFFACFLVVRVADQAGFGFRRATYFNVVVVLAYLGYSAWMALYQPSRGSWSDRLGVALIMYLVGTYLTFTGLVIERLRNRTRQAIRTARELVASLEQQRETLQAQTRELNQARSQAEQASSAKSDFLAMISHEIRTPMHGVLGANELLLGTALEARQRQYAKMAHNSATALLALIDDVLDFSRLEAGKMPIHVTRLDLGALIGEVFDLMAAAARDKPVTLRRTLPPQLPAVLEGDPLRLRQVLVNLLHNAVKFTEHGSVELRVAVLDETPSALRLRFEVRDTGIGIARDKLPLVFEAFTQADNTTTRRHGGSGLGLAIVKQLVELMDGRVGVESRPGRGSTFWFEIGLAKSVDEAAPRPAGAPLEEGRLKAYVLVAEDNVVNQMVVEGLMERLGCIVDVVGDGDAACVAARRNRYDMILMDCHMPVMDGFDATRRIRADEQRRGIRTPIIALTADALVGDRQRCIDCGMDDYLTKPINGAQLAAAVARWTGRQAGVPSHR